MWLTFVAHIETTGREKDTLLLFRCTICFDTEVSILLQSFSTIVFQIVPANVVVFVLLFLQFVVVTVLLMIRRES